MSRHVRTITHTKTLEARSRRPRQRQLSQQTVDDSLPFGRRVMLRFPGDIPNPLIPCRIHSRSGVPPLSRYERQALSQGRLNVHDPFDDEAEEEEEQNELREVE